MPFALSLVFTDASNAIETNMTDKSIPVSSITTPVASGWYNKIGIPAPIKKASTNAAESPVKTLIHSDVLLMG